MIGFIGIGNMGAAIIKGLQASSFNNSTICAYDINKTKVKDFGNVHICSNNIEVIEKSKYIFLAIKPLNYMDVLKELKEHLTQEHVIVSLAAGISIKEIQEYIGNIKVVRIMPNTPALVLKGFTAVSFDSFISNEEKQTVLELLNSFGICEVIDEEDMNIYSSITGSGPAYVFMMIEAMADAAVLLGMPRGAAYRAVSATILGSAELALQTSIHPGELKDMVCSPSGTTIEGVRTLEEKGFRSSLIECIINTYKKNKDINYIR